MASTYQQIEGAGAASLTTVYTAFTGGSATRAEFCFINFCNTTAADITVDMVFQRTDATQRFILDDATVPAKGVLQWSGLVVFDAALELLRLQFSATGVDFVGAVLEQIP